MEKISVIKEKMQSSAVIPVIKDITVELQIQLEGTKMNKLLLDVKEVAELFGVKVGTVKSWVSRGHMPEDIIFKIGSGKGTIRFKKSKLEDWINGSLQN